MQGFIQALTDLCLPEVKNLKLSLETQSFKPKSKKFIKTVLTTRREPYLFIFLSLGVINIVKSPYKNKKRDLKKRKGLCHQIMYGKVIWKPGSLNPQLQGSTHHLGLWLTAIKLNPLWKTEVSKSAWIKACLRNF